MSTDLFRVPPTAPTPFRTLDLSASVTYDSAALARLMLAAVASRAHQSSYKVITMGGARRGWTERLWSPVRDQIGCARRTRDQWGCYTCRVWWEPPSRWRDELTWPGSPPYVTLVREDAALAYLPIERLLYTSEPMVPDPRWEIVRPRSANMSVPTIANRNEAFPLLRPPLPASEWDFETVGEEEMYGERVTRRVRATRRLGVVLSDEAEASGYWPGVNEYECLVDDVLQILMRLTAIADGVPVGDVSVNDMRVDAPFPADIFTFVPPPGTRIAYIGST